MAYPAPTDRRWAWAAAGFAAGVGAGLLLPAVWGGPPGGPTVELVPGVAMEAITDDDTPVTAPPPPPVVAPAAAAADAATADADAAAANADAARANGGASAAAATGTATRGDPSSAAAAEGAATPAAPPPARSPPTVRISSLMLYPIKSCAGVSVASATVSSRGFVHDRSFLVVDFTGRFLSQRKLPRLALITPSVRTEPPSPSGPGGDVLVLAGPAVAPLDVPVTPVAGGGRAGRRRWR